MVKPRKSLRRNKHRKNRTHKRSHLRTRSRSFSRSRSRSLRGGNGQWSPAPWNPNTGGQYYVNNNTGGGVGGLDPALSTRDQSGGKRYRRSTRKQCGGGFSWQDLIPSDLLNLGRTATNGVSNVQNSYVGNQQSQSPLPTSQNALNTPYMPSRTYTNFNQYTTDARSTVASI
jgi:hypothetical protein